MRPVLLSLQDWDGLAGRIAKGLGADIGEVLVRRFPDDESYLRIETDVKGRNVILFTSLARPDNRILQVLFAAELARDLGATSVKLIAPYLPYMRQDKRFQPGEAVTSTYFAQLLSDRINGLVTIDPHLHRRTSLTEIYSIPTHVAHAAPLISNWIKTNVRQPVLVGPDEESAQWVAAVAEAADASHVVLKKIRRGDRDVDIEVPDLAHWKNKTPVLVDDIISTARTMTETVKHLAASGLAPPICIGVHGIFAGSAFEDLQKAGAARIVTTNAVDHSSNTIDVAALLVDGIQKLETGSPNDNAIPKGRGV